MNWDAIGAIGEAIAAFGVIVTLLYLAIQIKEHTKETRLSATRELSRDWADGLHRVSSDEKEFDLYLRAIADYESLTGGDRIKAYWMFSSGLRQCELQYFHVTQGNFERKLHTGMEYRIKEVAQFPGIQLWWKDNKQQFSTEFIEYVEKISNIIGEEKSLSL